MRIGVLGGTFDPPHNGHLAIAEAAQKQLELDEVLFVPAQRNPLKLKGPQASARDRLEMTRLAIQDHPTFGVSDQEIQRKGPSYTIETLHELLAIRHADYWLLMGFDALTKFHEWRSYQRIIKFARIGCLYRGDSTFEAESYQLTAEILAAVDIVEAPKVDISSTDIRLRIQEGKPWSNMVPNPVADYIRTHGLYK